MNLKAPVDTLNVTWQDTVDNHITYPSIAAVHAASVVKKCAADNLQSKREYVRNQTDRVTDAKVCDYYAAISKLETTYLQLCDNINDD